MNIVLTGHIMSETEELDISSITGNEKQAYEVFKDFHLCYLNSVGKLAELTDIMHSIMEKAYQPEQPRVIEQALRCVQMYTSHRQ